MTAMAPERESGTGREDPVTNALVAAMEAPSERAAAASALRDTRLRRHLRFTLLSTAAGIAIMVSAILALRFLKSPSEEQAFLGVFAAAGGAIVAVIGLLSAIGPVMASHARAYARAHRAEVERRQADMDAAALRERASRRTAVRHLVTAICDLNEGDPRAFSRHRVSLSHVVKAILAVERTLQDDEARLSPGELELQYQALEFVGQEAQRLLDRMPSPDAHEAVRDWTREWKESLRAAGAAPPKPIRMDGGVTA